MGRHQNEEQHKRYVKNTTSAPLMTNVNTQWRHWLRGVTVTLGISVLLMSGTTQAIASGEEDPTTIQPPQVSSLSTQDSDSAAAEESTDSPAQPEQPQLELPQPDPDLSQDDGEADVAPAEESESESESDDETLQKDPELSTKDENKPVTQARAAGKTTLRITKVGDRAGPGVRNGVPLAGATFNAYASTWGSEPEATGPSLGSCVTEGNGHCEIQIPNNSTTAYVWVKETAAPEGWQISQPFGLGQWNLKKTITPYEFRVKMGTGYSNHVRNVPKDRVLPDTVISDVWVNSRVNPKFPNRCGLSIAMVFDTSGSISRNEMIKFKTAAKSFVGNDGLAGTPSNVTMFQFSSHASLMNDGVPFDLAISGNGATGYTGAEEQIDALPKVGIGATNWDEAFTLVNDQGVYDMVLFLTDGDPTTYGGDTDTYSNDNVQFRFVEQAVMSANLIKNRTVPGGSKTKIVGVGVGLAENSNLNLRAVTGPEQGEDYFMSDFDGLQDVLKQLASKNCDGTLTVIKEIQNAEGEVINANADGWTFTAEGDVVVGSPKSQTTQAGTNFSMTFPRPEEGAVVKVTETPQKGYIYDGTTCTDGAGPLTETGSSFTVAVRPDASPTCTVVNKIIPVEAAISVNKTWIITDSSGEEILRTAHIPERARDVELPAGLSAQLALSGPSALATNSQSWGSERGGYVEGDSAIIDETTGIDENLLPGCELTSQKLTTEGEESTKESSFPLPHDATLSAGLNSFEITNTVACSTSMTLLKYVAEGRAEASDWDLTATLEGSDPVTSTTVGGEETETTANTFEVFDAQGYLLTEAIADSQTPLAYRLDRVEKCELETGVCSWAPVDGATSVSVDLGQHEVYRFVNKPLPLFAVPLTGGVSTDMLAISGGIVAVLALLIGVWYWRYSTRIKRLS